jgi:hypothetical protein
MSALKASDGTHFSTCKDAELERNTQGPQDSAGNHQTWLNAQRDPFILKFPPEISSHIFLLSTDTQSDDLQKLPTPFVLGSVCRGWRLLARSTPELWSNVSFNLAKPPRKPEGLSQLQAVSDWLRLSGDVPLTLHVFERWGVDSVSREGYANPVIDILNQHSGRWHKLLLDIPAFFFPRFCGPSPPSRLCDLHVIGDHYYPAPPFKMRSRPSPTHLTISYFSTSTFDINWDNLRFLKMTLTAFDGCIEAIQQAPLLEMCSITLCCVNFLPSIPEITVRHMRLRTLKLLGFPSELLCGYLDVLELPFLQTYHQQTLYLDNSVDTVISFFNRSRINLKQLAFNVTSSRKEDLKKLLTAVPSLQDLHLNLWCTENAFVIRELFEDLSSSPPVLEDGPGFLPSLQSLTISDPGIFIWECIPCLFSSPHRKLLRLEIINTTSKIEIDTLRQISRLIDEGFNIRIIGRHGDVHDLQQVKGSSGEEGKPRKRDKQGFLASFSSFISFLFCRR